MNVIVRPTRPVARTKAINAMIEEFGAGTVLIASLRALVARKTRPGLPIAPLNNHLRRDIGLGPAPDPDPAWRRMF
ncbi:MAG: hypothetical protein HRU32_01185 [Rhodobacteraceae bacterium]|nr:hypothetical protein [Paracoccaceae bacterium]